MRSAPQAAIWSRTRDDSAAPQGGLNDRVRAAGVGHDGPGIATAVGRSVNCVSISRHSTSTNTLSSRRHRSSGGSPEARAGGSPCLRSRHSSRALRRLAQAVAQSGRRELRQEDRRCATDRPRAPRAAPAWRPACSCLRGLRRSRRRARRRRLIPPVQLDQRLAPRRTDVRLAGNRSKLERHRAPICRALVCSSHSTKMLSPALTASLTRGPQRLGDADQKDVAQEDVDEAPGDGDEDQANASTMRIAGRPAAEAGAAAGTDAAGWNGRDCPPRGAATPTGGDVRGPRPD